MSSSDHAWPAPGGGQEFETVVPQGVPETSAPEPERIIWTHSGSRFALGYVYECYGIFDKATWMSGPVAGYPGTDEGWEEALEVFKSLEPNGWVTVVDHH